MGAVGFRVSLCAKRGNPARRPVGWGKRSVPTISQRARWWMVGTSLRSFAHPTAPSTTSRSRGADRPRFASSFALLENRGRREDRVLAAPAVSRAICANKTAHEHTGQRKHSGLPCAMALRLTSCSPRRTALLPPSPPRSFRPSWT